ncbi:MAG TPA: hypothetical protein VMV03_10860 [Spirochaetia bacterium]|nr:hypothetical protein [Spirochaetia bacterium]
MKRLSGFMAVCLLLWGCAPSQPSGEIMSAFRTFLQNVRAGDMVKVSATAPFLVSLPASQKEATLTYFRWLADKDPASLHLFVSHGAGSSWLLHVSAPGEKSAIVVTFLRNVDGRWVMGPAVKAIQHIDIVPAR